MSRSSWFQGNVDRALADTALRAAVGSTSSKKMAARAAAIAQVRTFEPLRDLAARIKQHALDHLDRYLDEFIRNVRARGGVVHRASTAGQANDIIVHIARDHGLRLCVKAKSMTAEETGLNHAMEGAGVRVVETDLGEFIVQLDHDRPSHIVTPIIHKNRQAVAKAFVRELGVEYTEDPQTLTRYARAHLREIFRTCDLGISGANFAVAETGTICVCTNEGNGRLALTRPKVHVVLMGIEKVIPRTADLSVFLKVLARSSTGQPITVYTSLVTGPRRPADPDGPEQLHVVILDGGRYAIRRGEFREVLRCIRCGACLNACPVYRRIGGHAYDSVYPGPIGKLVTPLLHDFDRYADLPQASSLCGLCAEVCPVKIDIPGVLVRLRREQIRRHTHGPGRQWAFRAVLAMLSSLWAYKVGQRLVRWFMPTGTDDAWCSRLPGPLARWTEHRDVPRPAAKPFRRLWDEQLAAEQNPRQGAVLAGTTRRQHPAPRGAEPQPSGSQGEERSGSPLQDDAETREPMAPGVHRFHRVPLPEIDPTVVRRVAAGDDVVSIFRAQAEGVGMRVHLTSSRALAAAVADLVVRLGQPSACAPGPAAAGESAPRLRVVIDPTLFCHDDLAGRVAQSAEILDPSLGDPAMYVADVGITGVEAAIAETGSLICASGPQRWRGMSLIPPTHVAIVRAEQILADLMDGLAGLRHPDLPAHVTLISGPSKTADIEGILITGVHGPREVHVIVVSP